MPSLINSSINFEDVSPGTKIKVLESFMFKRTAVVTKHAARGFDLFEDGQALMIANSNEDFVNKAVELLENTERRQTMEHTAQVIVEQNYSIKGLNGNPRKAFDRGCQIFAMNFQRADTYMIEYLIEIK